jgi:cytochrome c
MILKQCHHPIHSRPSEAFTLFLAWIFLISGCNGTLEKEAAKKAGGNPRRGIQAIQRYECSHCHTIPGVPGAKGRIGPSLARLASREVIAGNLPNTPGNLIGWIRDPARMDELASMPNQGVPLTDAKDIAAYLYTLR